MSQGSQEYLTWKVGGGGGGGGGGGVIKMVGCSLDEH